MKDSTLVSGCLLDGDVLGEGVDVSAVQSEMGPATDLHLLERMVMAADGIKQIRAAAVMPPGGVVQLTPVNTWQARGAVVVVLDGQVVGAVGCVVEQLCSRSTAFIPAISPVGPDTTTEGVVRVVHGNSPSSTSSAETSSSAPW